LGQVSYILFSWFLSKWILTDMNDPQIRRAFHGTFLHKEHAESNTLIVDELGLEHGKCRADIAVINGHLNGFEIKSEKDSLCRLANQVKIYSAVFDNASLVLAERHLKEASYLVPDWWGLILVTGDSTNGLHFSSIKSPQQNTNIEDYAVAQLLWRDEVQEILLNLGMKGKQLREIRANLYRYLTERMNSQDIRRLVIEHLRKRRNWRHRVQPFLYDD
jgi:hypothetical protein